MTALWSTLLDQTVSATQFYLGTLPLLQILSLTFRSELLSPCPVIMPSPVLQNAPCTIMPSGPSFLHCLFRVTKNEVCTYPHNKIAIDPSPATSTVDLNMSYLSAHIVDFSRHFKRMNTSTTKATYSACTVFN